MSQQNLISFTKLLSRLATLLRAANTLVDRAESVTPGANFVKATVDGKSFSAVGNQVNVTVLGDSVEITGTILTRTFAKSIYLSFISLQAGRNDYVFSDGFSNALGIYATSYSVGSYGNSGSAIVTVDTTQRVIFGTFSFIGDTGTIGSISVQNGSFSAKY